jgi:pimeloyl-ACP methyl ester carboxylesterase
LLGISYVTRLGLTLMLDHPAGIRSVILDSVVPPEVDLYGDAAQNGEAGFERTFAACAADAACAEKYPDPMAQLLSVITALDQEPLMACKRQIDGAEVANILFNLLYSPVAVAFVPRIIDDLAEGDSTLFEEVACDLGRVNFSLPMHLSIQCAEEVPFTSSEAIAALDSEVRPELVPGLSGAGFISVCAEWPVPAAAAIENQAVESGLPTLVLSGYFDPITPPRYGEQVDETLSNSQFFLVQNESHGASLSACGLSLVRAFLQAPGEPVEASCLSDLPPPTFESLRSQGSHRRVVGQRPKFVTETPTDEEIARAREDLERRLRL